MTTLYTRQSSLKDSNSLLYAARTTTFSLVGLPLDTPQLIAVDSAVNGPSDDVMIDNVGAVTFNKAGNYLIVYHMCLKAFSASVSNPVQFMDDILINVTRDALYNSHTFTDADTALVERTRLYQASAGDTLNCEVWLTSNGVDDGGLVSFINPGNGNPTIAFDIRIYKLWN